MTRGAAGARGWGAFADAETAYAAADRHDLAIAMYEHRLFDHQLRLIGQSTAPKP